MAHQIQFKHGRSRRGLTALLVLVFVCALGMAESFAYQNSNNQVNTIKRTAPSSKSRKKKKSGRPRLNSGKRITCRKKGPPRANANPPRGEPTTTPTPPNENKTQKAIETKETDEKKGNEAKKVEEQLRSIELSLSGFKISGFSTGETIAIVVALLLIYPVFFIIYRIFFKPKGNESEASGTWAKWYKWAALALIVIVLVAVGGVLLGVARGNRELKQQITPVQTTTNEIRNTLPGIIVQAAPVNPTATLPPPPTPKPQTTSAISPTPTPSVSPTPKVTPSPSPSLTPPPGPPGTAPSNPVWIQFSRVLGRTAFLLLGVLLISLGFALLSQTDRSGRWLRLVPVFIALIAFGYWSFYWHLRLSGAPELSAVGLATLPILLGFLFVNRESMSQILSKIGRLKVGTLEVEFDKAVQRIERDVMPPITVDETVFSSKRDLADLREEARKTIEKLMFQPVSKRVLYLRVDFGKDMEGYFDAAALYFYLLVLREAAEQVRGRLAGVLIYKSQESGTQLLGLVRTEDYITAFERKFPAVRGFVDLAQIQRDVSQLQTGSLYPTVFNFSIGLLDTDRSLSGFLPHLVPYVRQVKLVDEREVEGLPRLIPELLLERVDYVAVSRGGAIIAVVPLTTVTTAVARAVAESVQDKETPRSQKR